MKEQAIQKINKIGKISNVITVIAKIVVGTAMVVTLLGGIVCLVLPENLVRFTVEGDLVTEVDFSGLGVSMSEEELLEAQESLTVELAGKEHEFTEAELVGDKAIFKGALEDMSMNMRDIALIVILAMVALVVTFITLVFVSGLCKAFRDCQSPFEENVIKKMQNLAFALIPWTIVSTITNSISDTISNHKISLNLTLDLGVVLVVLIVLVLTYIFKYGAVLQQESDETL